MLTDLFTSLISVDFAVVGVVLAIVVDCLLVDVILVVLVGFVVVVDGLVVDVILVVVVDDDVTVAVVLVDDVVGVNVVVVPAVVVVRIHQVSSSRWIVALDRWMVVTAGEENNIRWLV